MHQKERTSRTMDLRLFAYIEKLKNENEFLVRHHRQCSLGDRHFTQPNYVQEGFTHDREAVLTVRPPSQSHPHHPPDLSYPPLLQLPLPHPPQLPLPHPPQLPLPHPPQLPLPHPPQLPLPHPPQLPLPHPPQLPHPIPSKSPDSLQPTRHPKSIRRPKKKLWEKYGDDLRWHEGDNQARMVEDNQVRIVEDNQVQVVEDSQVRIVEDNQVQVVEDNQVRIVEDNQVQVVEDSQVRIVEDNQARNNEDFGNNDGGLNERIKLILRGISLADAQDPLETLRQCSKELGNTKPQNPLELIKNYSIISNHTKRLAERARKVHAFQELIFVSACEVLLKNGYKLEVIDELMKLCISDSSTKNLERLRGGARWFCSLVSSRNAAWEHRITEHLFNCALSVSQYSILYSNAKKSTPYVLKHLEGIPATGGQDDVVDAERVNNFTGPTAGGQDVNGQAQVRRNEASDAAGGIHDSELSSDFIYMCMPIFVQAVLGKRFSLLNISKALTFGEHYHTIEMEDRNPYITKKMEWLFDKYVSIRDEASPEPRKGKRKRTRNDSSLKGKSKGFRQAVHRESSAREPLASIEPICNNAIPFANQHEMEGGDSHHTIWDPSSTEAPLGPERIAVHNLVSGCPSPDGSVISALPSMSSEVDCRDDEPGVAVGNDSNQGSNQFGCVEYGQLDASQQLCGTVDAPILFPNNNPNTLNAGNDQLNNGDTYGLNTSAVDYNPHNLATFAFDYNNPHNLATFAFDFNNPQDLATSAFNYNNPHNLATSAFDYDNPQDLATFASNYNTAYNQPQSCPPH
ncbi:hypothetical protein GMDG_03169 [Pseudogymnoascus destructans 20631-21]|uniref:Uncharacterized protein n=1 Tax=Pseudogymnoascus destructans (strain ATCC MYA-4855 / 20631-21) TaxID=658429 RepID=L8G531_PSED2|nr:hypothetical protein GMDG_03169 [Pseudogymnoascus destructans 20631-21]